MSIIPMLRAAEIVRALRKAGFGVIRHRGSHTHLRHSSDPTRYATVPYHSRDISRKDLASILRQSQLSVEEFLKLLKK
ncbi:addiction module toxin, HicA family [Candidatus Kaiserbacteria bacterium]|nr:addiction module toxin, HicA family [Candidatus Kaiserbacteria bacterium]